MTTIDTTTQDQPIVVQQGHIQQTVDAITSLFHTALSELNEGLMRSYARETEGLDAKSDRLSREYSRVAKNKAEFEYLLPADERLTRAEADRLLFSGSLTARQDAAAKLAEFEETKRRPMEMEQQLREISTQLDDIAEEKRLVARTVFEHWYASVQPVIRASEHGLFVVLLNGIEQSAYEYQERTNTGGSSNRQRPLLHPGRFAALTADERSPEWQAGTRWYGGRR